MNNNDSSLQFGIGKEKQSSKDWHCTGTYQIDSGGGAPATIDVDSNHHPLCEMGRQTAAMPEYRHPCHGKTCFNSKFQIQPCNEDNMQLGVNLVTGYSESFPCTCKNLWETFRIPRYYIWSLVSFGILELLETFWARVLIKKMVLQLFVWHTECMCCYFFAHQHFCIWLTTTWFYKVHDFLKQPC